MLPIRSCAVRLAKQMASAESTLLTNGWSKSRSIGTTAIRFRHSARLNTVVVFVPQQEAWVVERMGRFNKILGQPSLDRLHNNIFAYF